MTQPSDSQGSRLLREQLEYYRARAGEYDEWFLRQGRFDRGEEHRAEWFGEVAQVQDALAAADLTGDVLELASGTGWWTVQLAGPRTRVVALDGSLETIAINRRRNGGHRVSYVAADIFAPPIRSQFDAIFFSFWLSHVPADRFDEFWAFVAASLKRGGRVFFVDSLLEQTSTARDHGPLGDSGLVTRRLNDGREFTIVKIFHRPADLMARLRQLGWEGWVRSTGKFFLCGSVSPAISASAGPPSQSRR